MYTCNTQIYPQCTMSQTVTKHHLRSSWLHLTTAAATSSLWIQTPSCWWNLQGLSSSLCDTPLTYWPGFLLTPPQKPAQHPHSCSLEVPEELTPHRPRRDFSTPSLQSIQLRTFIPFHYTLGWALVLEDPGGLNSPCGLNKSLNWAEKCSRLSYG